MMRLSFKIFVLFSILFSIITCNTEIKDTGTKKTLSAKERDKALLKVNKYMVRAENEDINNYVKRHSWNMQSTGTGLRIEITKHGNGTLIKKGELVNMEYETSLIDGTMIYSSEIDGIKSFIVAHGGVESGLEEAILLLHYGDEANIVIPSHLAFGLQGDQKRIPSHASLIYKIKIINN